MESISVDIHCHPTLKPYGKSFPSGKHNPDIKENDSIYYYDPPDIFEKALNKFLSLTKFRQSNITALKYGFTKIIVAALYPLEKGFVRTKYGTGAIIDAGLDLVTGVGQARVDHLQKLSNGYYDDVYNEYLYLKAMDGVVVELNRHKVTYKLVSSYGEIMADKRQAEEKKQDGLYTVYVFLSIEGAHVLFNQFKDIGSNDPAIKEGVMQNVARLKGAGEKHWDHTPFFITFAHHFYNGLCGHARSLQDSLVDAFANQMLHINEPINNLGMEVIHELLSKQKGRRILIDIKHMSVASRKQYMALLKNDAQLRAESIPIVMSHGAARGNKSNADLFLDEDINFSDDEIIEIGRSKGLFGIQLDERRIASPPEIKYFRRFIFRRDVLYYGCRFVWRQIQHIAETLDWDGQYAWGIQCLGTDFDGIINPVDGIWTAENFPQLEDYLLKHAHNYIKEGHINRLTNPVNRAVKAEEIVDRFMGLNAESFLKSHSI